MFWHHASVRALDEREHPLSSTQSERQHCIEVRERRGTLIEVDLRASVQSRLKGTIRRLKDFVKSVDEGASRDRSLEGHGTFCDHFSMASRVRPDSDARVP